MLPCAPAGNPIAELDSTDQPADVVLSALGRDYVLAPDAVASCNDCRDALAKCVARARAQGAIQ